MIAVEALEVSPQADSPTRIVFLSHITEEAPVALALKKFIEESFDGQISVFASSALDDITPGQQWFREIEKALESCGVLLILCSPTSLTRPWINFEAGCGWRRKDMIPVCHLGQSRDQLPFPFSELKGLDLDDIDSGENLVRAISKHCGISKVPHVRRGEFHSKLSRAKRSIAASDVSPRIIHSQEERTKLLNNDLQMLLRSSAFRRETVWTSAFLSAFASGPEDPYFPERETYLNLVLKEKELLLDLARNGCEIKCIISPANENYVRQVGIDRAIRRTRRLIEFLNSEDEALSHIDWVISELGTKNLYIIGHISCFEGYKTGLDPGYGLTLRQTSREVIKANIELYRGFFEDLEAGTLTKWVVESRRYTRRRDLLRIGVIHCLEKSLKFLTDYSQRIVKREGADVV